MFEKEAEERAERKISNFIPQQWGVILIRTEQTYETVEGAPHFYLRSLAKMWKEGAEYGYNKAKIEVEDSYRESLCNAELNLASVTEQLEELEKANKWHKVADGDFPPKELEEKQLLVRVRNYTEDYFLAYYMLDKYYRKNGKRFYFDNDCDYPINIKNIIAWKEIVLPKEIKEND